MSVEQAKTIDTIGIDKMTGAVVLTIYDHVDWSDSRSHQLMLQAKLNSYLSFIESGELVDTYPNARARPVRICVVGKFEPDEDGQAFLARAKSVVQGAGFELIFTIFRPSPDP